MLPQSYRYLAKRKRGFGLLRLALVSQAAERQGEQSPPVFNISYNCKKHKVGPPERAKCNILCLVEVTGFCVRRQ